MKTPALALHAAATVVTAGRLLGQPAADSSAASPASEAKTPAPAPPTGILPLSDYGGGIWEREYLSGNWNGDRAWLAGKGVQFEMDWTQVVQSVASGGRETGTEYGGNLDYILNLDLDRMDLVPGGLVLLRGQSRYGESINGDTGLILPANTNAMIPQSSPIDEGVPFALTNATYVQDFSEQFGVLAGKFDTLSGDPGPFASGRGQTQFMNSNFLWASVASLIVPYDTLGAGAMWMPSEWVSLTGSVFTTSDCSTTSGFDNIGDGWTATGEVDTQYHLGALPGGMNLGAGYAWAQDFTKLNGRFVFNPGQGVSVPTEDQSWYASWSGWQYLYTKERVTGPIDMQGGAPTVQGVGLFSRVGFADQETNPVEWSANGGVGGCGLIPGRERDRFGAGYFYNAIQETRLTGLAGIQEYSQGIEVFYNFAVTPGAQITIDLQALDGVLSDRDTAWVLGVRLFLKI